MKKTSVRKGSFYSGTSNLVLPIKQSQFPASFKDASRLTYYASLFSSVEINSTFYKLPKGDTIEKWSDSVPDHFRFTFKVPKIVTHAKGFQFSFEDVERFAETVGHAGRKKGCLLIQLPPKITSDKDEELSGLLESLYDNTDGWNIAVEFRHPSWYTREVYRVLERYNTGVVVQDMPKSATPKLLLSQKFEYLRFHGPEAGYRGSYEDEALKEYADRIESWLKEGKDVYAYFNNTLGNALANLQTLNSFVESSNF